MSDLFPIADLRTLAARALESGDYTPAQSARVRAVPDTRTIRYYTTLGLIDRAAEMRGRTALYDRRHVMQVVAIKRLQAKNMTLSQIQRDLVGANRRKLAGIASLPVGFWDDAATYLDRAKTRRETKANRSSPNEANAEPEDRSAGPFWAQPVAKPDQAPAAPNPPAAEPAVSHCLQIQLQPGVRLSIDLTSERPPADIDLGKLAAASAELFDELKRQHLTG